MPARAPASDPQPGDVLVWNSYRVTVTQRTPTNVAYSVAKGKTTLRTGEQDLHAWSAWTASAKVKQRGISDQECVVLKWCASGMCRCDCGTYIENGAHSTAEGLWTAEHCPKAKHK